jgi:hypothetical protein
MFSGKKEHFEWVSLFDVFFRGRALLSGIT